MQCCAANSHDDEGDAALGKRYLHGRARRSVWGMCGGCCSFAVIDSHTVTGHTQVVRSDIHADIQLDLVVANLPVISCHKLQLNHRGSSWNSSKQGTGPARRTLNLEPQPVPVVARQNVDLSSEVQ